MIIYPAIDLRQGRCVRLSQGRKEQQTVYGEDPLLVARRWQEEGAEWLHLVNLDGAFDEDGAIEADLLPPNWRALKTLAEAITLPIQFGGGLRRWVDVQRAFALGARRVILGTAAIENRELLARALGEYGAERVSVGIDARDGQAVIHGWERAATLSAEELGQQMRDMGVRRVVHTDVARDGMLSGANIAASVALAQRTGLAVIVSGGVSKLSEIREIRDQEQVGLEGAIIGRALYTGAISLPESIEAARSGSASY
jgi:phosphoribosylformimino-5-aminoimidazole carboxamide ribotide isomerase